MSVVPWEGVSREPREWQRRALDAVLTEVRAGGRPLVSACTGAGKSVLIAEVVRIAADAAAGTGDVVIVATPTRALVVQLAATLAERLGANAVGVYYSEKKQPSRAVVVSCNPSLAGLTLDLAASGRRVRLLLIDEAHREAAPQVRETLPVLAPRVVVGVTATPFRADDRSIDAFTRCVFRYTIDEAQKDGVLCRYTPHSPFPDEIPDGGTSAEKVDAACESMIRRLAVGPGIVSATSIVDADAFAARLTAGGLPALSIHSTLTSAERASRIDRLLGGELRALVHVALLVEGVDIPPLRWLCLRRPTGSAVRLVQEVGRVLRTSPGKDRALLLDPHDVLRALGLVHDEDLGDSQGAALDAAVERDAGAPKGEGGPFVRQMPPPVAVSELRQWARRAVLSMVEAGFGSADLRGAGVRAGWASPRMVGRVRELAVAAKWLPPEIRPAVDAAIGKGDGLTVGEARDLVDLLGGLMIWREKASERVTWPAVDLRLVDAARAA